MPSRRSKIEMSPAEVQAYLEGEQILNVATIGPTGHPHLVAMWFIMIDHQPTFWTFAKSQKIVNLRRDDRITVMAESGDEYSELRGVQIAGAGRIIDDFDEVLEIGKRIGVKYQGEGVLSDEALPFLEAQARKRLAVRVDPAETVSWDHTKLGGAY